MRLAVQAQGRTFTEPSFQVPCSTPNLGTINTCDGETYCKNMYHVCAHKVRRALPQSISLAFIGCESLCNSWSSRATRCSSFSWSHFLHAEKTHRNTHKQTQSIRRSALNLRTLVNAAAPRCLRGNRPMSSLRPRPTVEHLKRKEKQSTEGNTQALHNLVERALRISRDAHSPTAPAMAHSLSVTTSSPLGWHGGARPHTTHFSYTRKGDARQPQTY